MTQRVLIEADGGSRGNPGPAGSGAVLIDFDSGTILAEIALFIGVATNNVAEYKAVLAAIELANEIAPEARLLVRMDSKLVVEQMSGRWKIKNEGMQELSVLMAKAIGSRDVSFEWIPREQNSKADSLANEAMDAESSVTRKFVGEPGTSTINVVTLASKNTAADLEYNPELPSSVRAPRNVTKKLTTVILVRHGRTALTETHKLSGRGGEDPQLSELGREDARKVALEIAKVGNSSVFAKLVPPSAIISSPIARTRETAKVIADQLGLSVSTEDDIAEIAFGEWDGHTNQEVAARWPEQYNAWRGDVQIAPPGGESLEEFDVRVQRGRDRILEQYEGQTVVVVSHVMPIRGFIKAATVSDWPIYWRVSVAPCSITVLRFWGEEAAEITTVNYTSHL
ncbi:MAG: bifunctional RNase H/acid phosphatase [Micrococcales bacterium]|nr:bifunctional RNase H/acid phosphatase [Microbacteriaceae bacterium]NBR22573.1 bifunctional RNase H/acid phosphatase [Micrococcales bacterium]NBR77993.1 bifunctional RNase H/acid phosphatase [Microbacteriaceae bacterium]NBS61224.1 bifunctional RNase H/acid phosphatase [Microbacteriaceae bacterium]NBX94167.1 bifunctional RNase H/acid phosphatase [Actinomycetota bacterium]